MIIRFVVCSLIIATLTTAAVLVLRSKSPPTACWVSR